VPREGVGINEGTIDVDIGIIVRCHRKEQFLHGSVLDLLHRKKGKDIEKKGKGEREKI
jgi:hypothetical protein